MPDLLLFFYLYVIVVSSFDLRNGAARVCALPAVAQYGLDWPLLFPLSRGRYVTVRLPVLVR